MVKSLLGALALIALGTSIFLSCSALGASSAHEVEIAQLREELSELREATTDFDDSVERRVVVSGLVNDGDPPEGVMAAYSLTTATAVDRPTGEAAQEAVDPWVESLSRDEEKLARLATLVRSQMEKAPDENRIAVRETLEEIQEEEEENRRNRRIEMMAERTRDKVKEYAERLNLYPAEEEEMTRILVDLSEERFDFFRRAREGEEEWSGIREKMQEMTDASNVELKVFLTEDQFVEYEKIRQEERAQQGWGWGRQRNNGDSKESSDSDQNQ